MDTDRKRARSRARTRSRQRRSVSQFKVTTFGTEGHKGHEEFEICQESTGLSTRRRRTTGRASIRRAPSSLGYPVSSSRRFGFVTYPSLPSLPSVQGWFALGPAPDAGQQSRLGFPSPACPPFRVRLSTLRSRSDYAWRCTRSYPSLPSFPSVQNWIAWAKSTPPGLTWIPRFFCYLRTAFHLGPITLAPSHRQSIAVDPRHCPEAAPPRPGQ